MVIKYHVIRLMARIARRLRLNAKPGQHKTLNNNTITCSKRLFLRLAWAQDRQGGRKGPIRPPFRGLIGPFLIPLAGPGTLPIRKGERFEQVWYLLFVLC